MTPIRDQFDAAILQAIAELEPNAYGVPIMAAVRERLPRIPSIGALYITLEYLERGGYVSSHEGDATAERGWRVKRYWHLEATGKQALAEWQAEL